MRTQMRTVENNNMNNNMNNNIKKAKLRQAGLILFATGLLLIAPNIMQLFR